MYMYGICFEYVMYMEGTCHVYVIIMYGICHVHVMYMVCICMVYVMYMSCICMEYVMYIVFQYVMDMHGTNLLYPRTHYYTWYIHGIYHVYHSHM